ncbi:MAG TPA: prolipoprotein diacylglyceryl transferase [Chloroflexota bacterium]|nr:prolipoprotein diacylglyceryl transferase [Candidatus Limnocylindria bacterium]HEU5316341.1 prolipoprotein diacylglyceryl transferase [Chloroflexota bacterium]
MQIDEIAFRIGPVAVHWYGIIIASAVLLGAVVGTLEARRRGEDPEQGWSMLLLVIVTAVIGARLYHVIHEWDFYSQNPALIPQIWTGGIGIPGAVIGGAAGIWWYTRGAHLNTARWLDIFAPALLLGQAVGRLGNYVNQELYGPPVQLCGTGGYLPCLPFGIQIDAEHRAGTPWDALTFPPETTQFVPMFAYEAVLNLVGMAVLLIVGRAFARRLYDGDIALLYIVWYGAVRSLLEGYRVNNWYIGPLPTAVWIGLAGVILAGGFLVLRHVRGWGTPGAFLRERERRTDDDAAPQPSAAEPSPG